MKMQAKRTLIEWLRDNYEINNREVTQVVSDIEGVIEEYCLTPGVTPDLADEDEDSENESDEDD